MEIGWEKDELFYGGSVVVGLMEFPWRREGVISFSLWVLACNQVFFVFAFVFFQQFSQKDHRFRPNFLPLCWGKKSKKKKEKEKEKKKKKKKKKKRKRKKKEKEKEKEKGNNFQNKQIFTLLKKLS